MRIRAALLFILLAPSPLAAQTVAGTLRDEESGRPIPIAFVRLLDTNDEQVRATLTDSAGHFLLAAPAAGRYRIRAEQIGYATALSPILTLQDGQVLVYAMTARPEPIMLDAIDVEAGRRCVVRPDVGERTARLWNEVRKALTVAAWTEEQTLFRFEYEVHERTLDAVTLAIRTEASRTMSGYVPQPFVSNPAEELAREGYIRGDGSDYQYFAPDAHVLLSDSFLDTHCFRIIPGDAEQDVLVGLEFEPVRGRDVAEITGVLWVDRESAELRYLEFHYTGGPRWSADPSVGGRVDFRRMPNGAWIVERWWIRMPTAVGPTGGEVRVTQLKETGGEVRRIHMPRETIATSPPPAAIVGTVYDSLRAAPLAGATVFLSGTAHATETDAAGRFRLDDVPAGTYRLGITHPRAEVTGIHLETRVLTLEEGRADTVMLATPSRSTLLAALCPDWDGPPDAAHIVGRVRNAATGRPARGAQLRFAYRTLGRGPARVREEWIAVTTDEYGRYAACGLPAGVRIDVRVTAPGGTTTDSLTLGRGELAIRPVEVH
ncbi:MAG TPA: carboxypeptidase regulatory-like domain-containing protein [Longimicrobiales bacterium]